MAAERELYLHAAMDGNELVGIAPLMLSVKRRYFLRQSVIEFIGTGESDYCDFIIPSDHKEIVIRAYFDYFAAATEQWDAISLVNIPAHSDTVGILEKILAQTRYGFRLRESFACPTLLIKQDPSFAVQCTKKKSLRRHFNYFDRTGQLTFHRLLDESEIRESLDDFFQQHIERRAIAGDLSKFENQMVRDFYKCLVTCFLPAGWLDFSVIKLDNIPIAYHFGFRYSGKFIWYKPAFNIDFINKSPGEVLIKLLLESAIEDGMNEFDFTIGDEAFKRRFSNEVRSNMWLDGVRQRSAWLFIRAVESMRAFVLTRLPSTSTTIKKYLKLIRHSQYRRAELAKNARPRFPGALIAARIFHCSKLLFDREVVAFYVSDGNQSVPQQNAADISIRYGNLTDSRPISNDMAPTDRKNLISRWHFRLKSGERLLVAESLGKPLLYAWVKSTVPDRIRHALGSANVSEGSAFIYDFHIMESQSSNEPAAMATYLMAEKLRDDRAQTIIVGGENSSAFSTITERAGFQRCFTYVKLKLFGLSISWRNFS